MIRTWFSRKPSLQRTTSARHARSRPVSGMRARRRAARRLGLESLEARRVLAPVINEIHFAPVGGDHNVDQYVEIRGEPNEVLASGTYLVVVDGDSFVNTPGAIHTVFDLSGLQLGTNGFLVLAQQGSNFAIDGAATVLKGTTGGFGGLKAATDPGGTDRYSDTAPLSNAIAAGVFESNTFFLIQTDTAPVAGGDMDANNDGTPDGVYADWTVIDAVSVLDGGDDTFAYANLVFAKSGKGTTLPGATVVSTSGSAGAYTTWLGRNDDTTGSDPSAWISAQTQERGDGTFVFRLNNGTVIPPVFSGRNLDHVGAPNFGASILGTVFQDDDGDSVQDAGEIGLPNFPIFLDHNNNGVHDDYGVVVEPDDFLDGTVVQNLTLGVTLTVADTEGSAFPNGQFPEDTIPVKATDSPSWSSTGVRVFSHADVDFFNDFRRLRMDFYQPAKAVTIDVIGFAGPTKGRLRIYNAAGEELDSVETIDPIGNGQVATLSLSRPTADIAYAFAYSPNFNGNEFGRFDNLRFTLTERIVTTDANGNYEIPRVDPGPHTVRAIQQPGHIQNFPASGSHSLNLANTANVTGVNFANRVNLPPQVEPQTLNVNENSSSGASVGTVVATDDPVQALSYEIVGGTGQGVFVIDANTGELTVADGAELNFEAVASYTLEVRVSDSAPAPAVTTATVTVNVSDLNEAPSDLLLSSTAIAENTDTSIGAVVGELSAIDPDTAPTHVFSLVAGAGDADNALVEIVGGQLRVKPGVTLDHETQASLAVRIEVFDGANTLQKALTINVTDLDEPATAVALSPDAISENADASAGPVVVGELTANDPDAGAAYTFELVSGEGDADNARFEIDGAQLLLRQGETLDRETQPALSVRVRAADGTHEVTQVVTIQVADENEPPQIAPQSFTVAENAAVGTSVGVVEATDPDAGQTLTFSIWNPLGEFLIPGGPSPFAIDPATGEITVADSALLDFEASPTMTILVTATDDADPTLSSQAEITIHLTDVDDAPTDVTLDGALIAEDADTAAGRVLVGVLGVVAPGGGANSAHVYTLVGDGGALFEIDGNELYVKQGAALDHETSPSLAVRVSASNGVDSAERDFTIDVTDVNEAPDDLTLSNTTVPDTADTSAGPVDVGQLAALDPDAPGAFAEYVFTLEGGVGGADNDSFQIVDGVLQVKEGVTLDRIAKPTYSLRVRADDGTHPLSKIFVVQVTDGNELPVAQDDEQSTGQEQSVTVNVLANDDDPDGDLDPASVSVVGEPAHGAVEVRDDGAIVYTPAAGFTGEDTFRYTVADTEGGVSNEATVTINVTAGPAWQNHAFPADANGDTVVNLVDLLDVVQFLRQNGVGHALTGSPEAGQAKIDVNGDNTADVFDLLLIVQHLRAQQAEGEGEAEAGAADAPSAAPSEAASLLFAGDDGDEEWDALLSDLARDMVSAKEKR